MITQNEISSLNLSPTKKDFVQIWNELIEVASKITERWDPTSTNESDPGIVLLKVLAGIADKLNYNIDKNILEAFMPTAAQMESMRKLCELVGYDIKYYQSAETKVRIKYTGNTSDRSADNDEKLPDLGLQIPKFTTITNADKDITFVTTNEIPVFITNDNPWVEVSCIEGQISQCESINENNLITLAQLDDEYRYYLPEIQIAENGIFVYNAAISSGGTYIDGTPWEQVLNLNTRSTETRVFKFGYDSFEGRPYLAFPEDVGSLIGDGLFIYFIRTSGLNGNISPRTLEVLELPAGEGWDDRSAEQFEVVNVDATTNGANIESISAAYNNFKKTVGTFDTLVTCRDYMNKIYSLMDANNSPYVSNILVTDIRNDINSAITLCSCNEFGILYKEMPLTKTTSIASSIRAEGPKDGTTDVYSLIVDQDPNNKTEVPLIDHFDLLLYPFKTFTQVSSSATDFVEPYNKSFTYTEQMNAEIEASLADLKTCAHSLTTPVEGDIIAINNYLRLNAFIATSIKVSEIEAKSILANVKAALVNEFNLRNLDFGEEIPFENILAVIENADSRIKVVSLQEPTVLTTYSVKERVEGDLTTSFTSKEYGIASSADEEIYGVNYSDEAGNDYRTAKGETAKDLYNKLTLRNILAGRASLFDYDETFVANNYEKPYTITKRLAVDTDVLESLDYPIGEHLLTPDKVAATEGGTVTLRVFEQKHKDEESGEIITDIQKEVYETYTPALLLDEEKQPTLKGDTIADITRVEAVCEISSTSEDGLFDNITLAKNEVIKFRAPNLITTKTFPAYVYYHFEHKDATSNSSGANMLTGSEYGSFAKAMTLSEFINQDNIGANKFFAKLWEEAGIDFSNKDYTFEAERDDPTNPKIPSGGKLANIFNTAIAVEADTQLQVKKKDPITGLPVEPVDYVDYFKDDQPKIFIKKSDFENVLSEHFSNSANNIPVKFRYYPLTYHTSSIWSSCIKKLDTSLPTNDLWQLSSTSSYPRGRLVTESGKKLSGLNGDSLTQGNVGELVYICTYLGSDPNYASIEEKSEIELGPNDKLYIHYTPSSTNEDGETVNAEPVSIVYEGGIKTDSKGNKTDPIIIKPSGFTLMPSDDVNRQGTSWKKTDVDFGSHGRKNLLALAPNEQIEMRSISKVVLNKPARFYKNFDNIDLERININEPYSYELKDGEYIFYTDLNTQEAAYYGSGSVITLEGGANIPKASDPVEVSQILEKGLHVVPWSNTVLLSDSRKITITEYQYITLTEGDTLNTLTVNTKNEDNQEIWKKTRESENTSSLTLGSISAGWIKCDQESPITYTTSGAKTATSLPKISLGQDSQTTWEVCSFLELSTSPGYAQQLRAAASGTDTNTSITNKIKVYTSTGTSEKLAAVITPQPTSIPGSSGTFEDISIKLNTIAQTATGSFEKPRNTDKDTKTVIQMKIFKEEAPAKIELDSLDEAITPISTKYTAPAVAKVTDINNYWSKIDISAELQRSYTKVTTETTEDGTQTEIPEQVSKPNALKLNFMIPDDDLFGIFSIYLEVPVDKLDSRSKQNMLNSGAKVFIDVPDELGDYKDVISIFNNNNEWWSEGIAKKHNRLYLRAGLNCIKVTKSCSLFIKAEASAVGNILYDNMKLVRGIATNGVNLKLLDPDATFNAESAKAEKTIDQKKNLANAVLDGINALDKNHEFYYNVPIENSLAMEFNDNINSFSNPYTLYDINNINNSFVVSKLDVAYLDKGLSIAKSSRY